MEAKHKGIKRHEALYSLSHHHHHALVVALHLKQAGTEKSKLSLEEIKKEVQDFWEPGGLQHFREEEEILLTAYAQYASIDQPEIAEMLLEHIKIHAKIDSLGKLEGNPVSLMNELGELLDGHIRKEERVVFPMIESALPEDKLKELSSHLHVNDTKL
ncbi:hemerythrin domain-containing protein [Virgibacillus necropolis]|uniref:hemerythrin domain-containing protein n=1 Tax=Virgibacillus necropolis TaxID=163877 RepID=UPI00384B313F